MTTIKYQKQALQFILIKCVGGINFGVLFYKNDYNTGMEEATDFK